MTRKKEAPTGQGQGLHFNSNLFYRTAPRLSIAADIILLIEQAPDHADRLRAACWDRLEQVLRRHYAEGRAGQ